VAGHEAEDTGEVKMEVYGGSFISETLTHAIEELKDAYAPYAQLDVADTRDGWVLMTASL